jgi:hemerythrin superfamily protein
MDAIELLTTQHAEVEALFEKLEQESDEVSRRELFGRLVDRLTMHTTLEEEIFYPALGALPGGASMAAHARDEHRNVKQLLEGLRDPHLEGAHAASVCTSCAERSSTTSPRRSRT